MQAATRGMSRNEEAHHNQHKTRPTTLTPRECWLADRDSGKNLLGGRVLAPDNGPFTGWFMLTNAFFPIT
jgi:hypothetical protein